jgi:hypothetical protein
VTKENGFIYINAPSNGGYHTYPLDCWRFYPDAALALVEWANYNNTKMTLIESFIAHRINTYWNDCIMIFKKGEHTDYSGPYLNHHYSSIDNLRLNSSPDVLKLEYKSEDLRLLEKERLARKTLEQECERLTKILNSSRE